MEQMVLGRAGHYHVPSGDTAGTCQTAIVAFKHGDRPILAVNVAAWQHDGEPFRRLDVPVVAPDSVTGHSFHLTRDCPYGR